MKRVILKILLSFTVFCLALYISGKIMNRGNVNTTRAMDSASLPVIYMNIGGDDVNTLYGYSSEMDVAYLRENITPLEEGRGVSFRVVKYGNSVSKVNIKVRTADGSRLIENTDISEYMEDDYGIFASVTLKDLLTDYTEYSLQIYLTLSGGREIMYHTKVIQAPSYCTREKLAFVKNFVEKEGSVETNAELKNYMESNYLGDNTTLAKVGIHSSMKQLAFADLSVQRLTAPIITIKEIASETGIFVVNYLVASNEEDDYKRYFIEEFYRIKYTPEETFLLDYERTMTEVCEDIENSIRTDDILLGIGSEDINLIESDDGNQITFVTANSLYSYNVSEYKLVKLFSFYDSENFDVRTYRNEHAIKPLRIDEAGNVWFVVYGYMNRGTYEGRVGITLYYYNGVTNVVEEQFFISSKEAPDMVCLDMDELSYLSNDGIFFFLLDKTIYAVNVEEKTSEILITDLEENKYSVSDDSTLMIWLDGTDVNASEKIKLMNLNSKQISEVKAPEGQYIKPLTFIGQDFAYGLAYKEDVSTDNTGRTTFPMYCVKIQNRFGENLKEYRKDDIYVTEVSVNDNLLTLSRITPSTKQEGAFVDAPDDYITNNQEKDELQNNVNVFSFGNYEKVVRITLKRSVKSKIVVLTPQEVIYEGSGELMIDKASPDLNYYYVYYGGKLQSIYTKASNAVTEANSNYGTVLNNKGYYVWYRANRDLRNQIMDLSYDAKKKGEEYNPLTTCLDYMLDYAGVVRNSEYLLNNGETILSILTEALSDCDVLDLTGCPMDSVLYYVNRDIPVLVLEHSGEAMLLIGFNQLSVVVYEPSKGTYKLGRNEAEKLFTENGNQFITYVPNK